MTTPIATVEPHAYSPWWGVVIGGIAFTHFREREHAVGVAAVINGAVAGLSTERDGLRAQRNALLDAAKLAHARLVVQDGPLGSVEVTALAKAIAQARVQP